MAELIHTKLTPQLLQGLSHFWPVPLRHCGICFMVMTRHMSLTKLADRTYKTAYTSIVSLI